MADSDGSDPASLAWRQQSIWSQSANQLKKSITRSRTAGLCLTVLAAVLGTGAAQAASWSPGVAKGLALGAAIAVALGPVGARYATLERTRDWTRLRSVSETIKADVYTYLAGVRPFDGEHPDHLLISRMNRLLDEARDLGKYSAGISPVVRDLPPVDGVDSYMTYRLAAQIDGYYRPKAREMRQRVAWIRQAELALSVIAAVLAAIGAVYGKQASAAWVAAVTTIIAAVTAHGAASRYEYQAIEFARTGDELERLRARYSIGEVPDIVQESEHIISIQNEGWMAKLSSSEP